MSETITTPTGSGSASGESSISARRSTSRTPRKKKKSQIPQGLLVLILIVAAGLFLGFRNTNLGFFWATGIAFGFILQRSRFCFTASLRDPYLTGGTSLTKAVLVALAITSLGFWAIKFGAFQRGLPIPGQSFVVPISLGTAFGAVTFGTGMVIAGGCASGTLMRTGEGFLMNMISLAFFVIGSFAGAATYGWWTENVILRGRAVFLPDVLGWFGAIGVQLAIIVLLWIAADKWAKAKAGASSH